MSYLRKNRNIYSDQKNVCDPDLQGVDLSRNYGFKFAYDDEGSSGDPCADDYRGPSAFSEPETQAMRDFLDKYPGIKLAINWHAYGNNMDMPYNYADENNSDFIDENPLAYQFLLNLAMAAPLDMKLGNRAKTTNHKTNGEVSDYMFGEKGILAVSPEIGSSDFKSLTYYIEYPKTQLEMLSSHNKWVYRAALNLLPRLNMTLDHWSQKDQTFHGEFSIKNRGLGRLHG